jgi:anti-anti-sigma factor
VRRAWTPFSNGRQIGTILILGGVYFVAAKLGLRLAAIHPSATPVWPNTGIALASLLLLGYRAWPGIFLGAFLANLTTEGTVWTSLGIATGNTLEGLVGAHLVTRYATGKEAFTRPLSIFRFALLGAVLSTAVSATIGVTSLALGGFARWGDYVPIWLTWWLGDGTGALIVAPALILWSTLPRSRLDARALVERALFLLTLLLVSWIVFGGGFPFAYLTVPFLIWAAFRFGLQETATVIVLLAVIAIWGTVKGLGPFVGGTPNESLLLLQAFMGLMVLVALPLGSIVAERGASERALRHRQAEEELITAIARMTAGETDIGGMLTVALEELRQSIRFTGGSIALVEGEELIIRAAVGPFAESALGQRMPRGQSIVWQVVATEAPFLSNDLVAQGLTPTTPIRSYLAVPLRWQGRGFGVLEVDSVHAHAFQPADLVLMQRVADTISGSIELARRFAAEVAAKAEAEAAREERGRLYEHLSSLQRVTAALAQAVTPEQVIEVIVEQGVRAMGAEAGAFYQVIDEGSALEVVRAIGYQEDIAGPWRRHSISTVTWATDALRNQDGVFLESGSELLLRYPHLADVARPFPDGASVAVPLIIGARSVGILVLNFAQPRRFEENDRALLLGIGRQYAQALDRARLYEREHHVAETLQRALLPADLPHLPGIGIHAVYVPGRGAEVGGDWYDVFRLPDGHIALSVGDVVGRGLQAAVIMGQLRQAIRAAALQGYAPGMVLSQANKVLQLTSSEEGMATAIFGILEPATLTFTYAAAGHPGPVLAAPDGRIETLATGDMLPLGVSGPGLPSYRTVVLAPGSLMVLYTDGLIESTRDISEGEAELRSAVGAELQRPSADPARAILNRVLGGGAAEDDVAIVALSIAPQPLHRLVLTLPAVPASAREVRQAFQRLAGAQGLDKDRAAMFEVALGEAVTNAVEHAYGAARGDLSVRVWLEGDTLVAEVEDQGRWRRERSEGRGYGLQIMRAMVDALRVDRRPSGTVVGLMLSHATAPVASETGRPTPPAREPLGAHADGPVEAGESGPQAVMSIRSDGRFRVEHATNVPVVKVGGDVDVGNAHDLEAVVEDAARIDKRAVVVDLAGASFLDSKALHVLLRLAERLGTNRQQLLIVIPQDRILRRVLEIAGVMHALSVFDSLDNALAGVARGGGAEDRV